MASLYDDYTQTSSSFEENFQQKIDYTVTYFKQNFLPHIKDDKNIKILDIGCGWGNYLKALQILGFTDVQGCDISPEQVKYAKEKLGIEKVFESDVESFLQNSPDKFDVIMAIDLMEHLDAEKSVEIGKAVNSKLKEGGVFLVQVPNGINLISPYFHSDITHFRAYSEKSMEQFFKMSGFNKFNFSEANSLVAGKTAILQKLLWKFVFRPFTKAYLISLLGNGHAGFNVFTANIIGIAKK